MLKYNGDEEVVVIPNDSYAAKFAKKNKIKSKLI